MGMTGGSEMTLLREKNIKMGGIVYSINWCTGVKENLLFSSDGDVHSMSKRTLEAALEALGNG